MTTIKVLLIDRQDSMRERLRAALHNHADIAVVGEAADAAVAAVLMVKMQPHVAIIGLSDLPGTDLLASICDFRHHCRVVVLATHSDPNHILGVLQAGAHGVLLKDSARQSLADAVRAVQAGGTFFSGEASAALMRDYVGPRKAISQRLTVDLARLSSRERQVLHMVVSGLNSREIAQQLAISPKSVGTYRGRLMAKIGVTDTPALINFAAENGLM